MINETRNELLCLLYMIKAKNEKDKKYYLESILDCYERDIQKKNEELERQKETIKNELELLNYVKSEIKKGGE